jgi:hypothetical protein
MDLYERMELNRRSAAGNERFRVINMSYRYDGRAPRRRRGVEENGL